MAKGRLGTSIKAKQAQANAVFDALAEYYGPVDCTLNYQDDPWRLLVGAILAAQCTDERVNQVTPALFERYPTIEAMSQASPALIEPFIKSCGLFRNKAKGIYGSAVKLMQDFGGVVPQRREDLLSLPGVGRKIANLLIGDVFGGQAIVVDTHCGRLARLMGFTQSNEPYKIECDLMKVVPEHRWSAWGHYMVEHGRAICSARSPKCDLCPVAAFCQQGLKVRRRTQRDAKVI